MAKVECLAGVKTFEAETDLSAKQYLLVEHGGSAGQVDIPDSDSDIPIGVLQNEPAAGENAVVRLLNDIGTCTMIASTTISVGDLVVPAAVATLAGKIRTLPTGTNGTYYLVGRALEEATANGDEIEVQLMPSVQRVITGN